MALNRITIKYWFTNEPMATDLVTEVDYTAIGNFDLGATPRMITNTAVSPARTNADFVTTFAIMSDRLAIESARLIIRCRTHRPNYQGTFTMTNDYSFGPNQTTTMPWPRVTAYIDGVLYAGTEPM